MPKFEPRTYQIRSDNHCGLWRNSAGRSTSAFKSGATFRHPRCNQMKHTAKEEIWAGHLSDRTLNKHKVEGRSNTALRIVRIWAGIFQNKITAPARFVQGIQLGKWCSSQITEWILIKISVGADYSKYFFVNSCPI